MQRLAKEGVLLTFVVAGLIFCVFMLLLTTNTIANVSAVYTNVGVYWDSDYNDPVLEILWGNLTPGSSKSIIVYILNEIEEPIYLKLSTQDWDPSIASLYMTLRWDYTWQRMNPNETLQITLTLFVSRYIEGISSFNFDIVITRSDSLPGDVNGDGRINSIDLGKLGSAYGSMPGQPNWNPEADFDASGMVGSRDLGILGLNYGKDYS